MFYSFQRLIEDVNIVRFNGKGKNDFSSIESAEQVVSKARSRIIIKMVITFLGIGACAFLVGRVGARETEIRIGHVGFGMVIGYWFR